MKRALLLDLGDTLVAYYTRAEFPLVLRESIGEVATLLLDEGLLTVDPETMWARVEAENHESPDYRVRPLEERLSRIFQLPARPALLQEMCRRFLAPAFARARRYADTLPFLAEAQARGFQTALVSNLPWGSPASLWREEIARHGLDEYLELTVFCTDVGWRKPARPIFELTLEQLRVAPQQCIFVGDHLQWDIAGARAVGIDAVWIDRRGTAPETDERPIQQLAELWDRLSLQKGAEQ